MNRIPLIALGLILCVLAILLRPLLKRIMRTDVCRPWIDGLIVNTLRAFAKYPTRTWLRRAVGICKNPDLTRQYLTIMSNKQHVHGASTTVLRFTVNLTPMHDVQTTHPHHRQRVEALKSGQPIDSSFGPIIVVGDKIHDGHHRIAAAKEANVDVVEVLQFWER